MMIISIYAVMIRKNLSSAKAIRKLDTFIKFSQNNDLASYKKLTEQERSMSYSEIVNAYRIKGEY